MRVARALEFGGPDLRVVARRRRPREVTGEGPAGGEPFLQLVNGGPPFAAVPCSARLRIPGIPETR
jgi:hypothetical protein